MKNINKLNFENQFFDPVILSYGAKLHKFTSSENIYLDKLNNHAHSMDIGIILKGIVKKETGS